MKKRQYEKPLMEAVELEQEQALLAGSLNDPENYPDGGDPFNF
jgi:hypothetical protein